MARQRAAVSAPAFKLPDAAPLTNFDPFELARQFDSMRTAGAASPAQFAMPTAQPVAQPTWNAGPAPAGGTVVPGRPAAGGSTFAQWVDTIAQIKGLSGSDKAAFAKLGMGESGGRNIPQGIKDVNTAKGTPAFGPWQVIQPTFERYKEPGYDDWHDPIANGLASINYQRARYGALRDRPGY